MLRLKLQNQFQQIRLLKYLLIPIIFQVLINLLLLIISLIQENSHHLTNSQVLTYSLILINLHHQNYLQVQKSSQLLIIFHNQKCFPILNISLIQKSSQVQIIFLVLENFQHLTSFQHLTF